MSDYNLNPGVTIFSCVTLANYITFLYLSYNIYKMEIKIVPIKSYKVRKALEIVLGIH